MLTVSVVVLTVSVLLSVWWKSDKFHEIWWISEKSDKFHEICWIWWILLNFAEFADFLCPAVSILGPAVSVLGPVVSVLVPAVTVLYRLCQYCTGCVSSGTGSGNQTVYPVVVTRQCTRRVVTVPPYHHDVPVLPHYPGYLPPPTTPPPSPSVVHASTDTVSQWFTRLLLVTMRSIEK